MEKNSNDQLTLSQLSRQNIDVVHANSIVQDLKSSNDRSACIIGASLVDSALETAIKTKFVDLDDDQYRDLFAGNGPISTSSSRKLIAQALGLIDAEMTKDLSTIAKVRNAFAHTAGDVSFETKAIADACKSLRIISEHKLLEKMPSASLADGPPWLYILDDYRRAGFDAELMNGTSPRDIFLNCVMLTWYILTGLVISHSTQQGASPDKLP